MTKTMVTSIDYGAWKARFDEASAQIQDRARGVWLGLERDPARLRRLQNALIVLLVLWSLSSVAQLVWVPFRAGAIETAPALALNPPTSIAQGETEIIDTSSVLGSNLFGSAPDGAIDAFDSAANTDDRDGIERNANETRLALTLTGIAASSDDGRGSAVIQSGSTEQVFSVGDTLPASGRVVLAKVMPQQVVIDNNGTYELISLYDGPGIAVPTRPVTRPASASPASTAVSMPACLRRAGRAPTSAVRSQDSIANSSMTTPNPSPAWCLCRRCERTIVLWVIALPLALIALPSTRLDFSVAIL